jgi:myosin protein heavy chain
MRLQKESEEKHESLRKAFDQAAEHLVRLEQQEHQRDGRELELNEKLKMARDEIEILQGDLDRVHKVSQNLETVVSQREELLARAKEREENAVIELRGKLKVETESRCYSSFVLL